MVFPMPRQIAMWQVCRYFRITPAEYYALDNEDAVWAHALVNADGDAAKQ